MPDFGVVLNLPTESVAIRATVGSLVGLALVALLLRTGLQVPRVRSTAVLVPVFALLGAVALSWKDPLLPWLSTLTDGDDQLVILVRGAYLGLAPLWWPLLALWSAVAGWRVWRRIRVMRQMRLVASSGARPRDLRVLDLVLRVSRALRVPTPRVLVVDGCPGGAVVVGVREPRLVIDAALLSSFDDEELEGLLAHEVAHIRRRDNLLALIVGLVRDVCFFVPGGRWVTRRLCAERELAADQLAIGTTSRPGALASGLLKVIDHQRPAVACAAFAAPAAVIGRVERLVREPQDAGAGRSVVESALVAGALTLSVAAATMLPTAVANLTTDDGKLYSGVALAVVPHPQHEVSDSAAVAFEVFRSSTPDERVRPSPGRVALEPGQEFHPAYLTGRRAVVDRLVPAGTAPNVTARADRELMERWSATPVVSNDDGLFVYLLHRSTAAG